MLDFLVDAIATERLIEVQSAQVKGRWSSYYVSIIQYCSSEKSHNRPTERLSNSEWPATSTASLLERIHENHVPKACLDFGAVWEGTVQYYCSLESAAENNSRFQYRGPR